MNSYIVVSGVGPGGKNQEAGEHYHRKFHFFPLCLIESARWKLHQRNKVLSEIKPDRVYKRKEQTKINLRGNIGDQVGFS